jgi:hypothetical protein
VDSGCLFVDAKREIPKIEKIRIKNGTSGNGNTDPDSLALSRAVGTIAELGIADQIEAGSPRSVESLAGAKQTHDSVYRAILSGRVRRSEPTRRVRDEIGKASHYPPFSSHGFFCWTVGMTEIGEVPERKR